MVRATWQGLDGRLVVGRQRTAEPAAPTKQDTGKPASLQPLPATRALVPFVPIKAYQPKAVG